MPSRMERYNFAWEGSVAGRNRNLADNSVIPTATVHPDRAADRIRDEVDHHVGEHLVLSKRRL